MSWKDRGKLSPEDIANIIAEVRGGAKRIDVARKYGINHSTVYYYCGSGEEKPRNNSFDIKEYNKKWQEKNKEKLKEYQKNYRQEKITIGKSKRKQGRGLNAGKSYKELLEIENEKRKKAGLWLYKPSKNKL